MAQPTYAIDYLGAIEAKKNTTVLSAGILTQYPTATVLKIKTKGVSVSVDNSVMFEVSFDDESFLQTGHSYTFNQDCVIAVGIYKVVV